MTFRRLRSFLARLAAEAIGHRPHDELGEVGFCCTRNQKRRLSIEGELAVRLRRGRSGAARPVDQRKLAEDDAGTGVLEQLAVFAQGHGARLHHVNPVSAVALGEDRLARFEGLAVSGPLQQGDDTGLLSCLASAMAT